MPDSARPSAPSFYGAEPQTDVTWLRVWAKQECGVGFSDEQSAIFSSRIDALCAEVGEPLALVRQRVVAGDRKTRERVIEAVSTTYTCFLREPETFAYLRDVLFDRLGDKPSVRVWSAAASSGDEAYSIAMMATESGTMTRGRVAVLGTDVNAKQLRLAEAGEFRAEQLQLLDASRRARFFEAGADGVLRVGPELRACTLFRRLNLLRRPWPFQQKFHIVFLRNVLYYFEEATARGVLERVCDCIEVGGYLVLSLTESMTLSKDQWRCVHPAVFQKMLP
jgi:chemotaxis protein methyltransferase CheR